MVIILCNLKKNYLIFHIVIKPFEDIDLKFLGYFKFLVKWKLMKSKQTRDRKIST